MTSAPSNKGLFLSRIHSFYLTSSSRSYWLMGGLFIVLFFFTRLINLAALPIFVDEGIYIRWSRQMLATGTILYGSPADKLLYVWLMMLVIPWVSNSLALLRALSAIIGLASCLATIYLAYTLWPQQKNLGWTTALIYLFLPFPLIFERMALADGLLTLFTTLILALSIKLSRHPQKLTGFALGVCIGLAYLTKRSGLIYLPVPVLCFILLEQKSFKALILPYLVTFLVILLTIPVFLPLLFVEAVRSAFNPIGSNITPVAWQLYSLGETWLDLAAYVTWPVLFLALTRLLFDLRSGKREAFILALTLLITPDTYLLLARDVWYSRYLLPIAHIFIVLAARALTDIAMLLGQNTRLKCSGLWLGALYLLAMLPGLIFDYQLLTTPDKASFTPVDRWQYVTGWPAGYGVSEATAWLQQKANQDRPITVLTNIRSGPAREGIRFYLGNRQTNIHFRSMDLANISKETLQSFIQTKPTLLLLNEPADQDQPPWSLLCPTTAAIFPKPENESRLLVKACDSP